MDTSEYKIRAYALFHFSLESGRCFRFLGGHSGKGLGSSSLYSEKPDVKCTQEFRAFTNRKPPQMLLRYSTRLSDV